MGNLTISFGPDNSWDSGETIDIIPVPVKVVSTNVWQAVVNYDSNLSTGISPNVEVKEGAAVQQGGQRRRLRQSVIFRGPSTVEVAGLGKLIYGTNAVNYRVRKSASGTLAPAVQLWWSIRPV